MDEIVLKLKKYKDSINGEKKPWFKCKAFVRYYGGDINSDTFVTDEDTDEDFYFVARKLAQKYKSAIIKNPEQFFNGEEFYEFTVEVYQYNNSISEFIDFLKQKMSYQDYYSIYKVLDDSVDSIKTAAIKLNNLRKAGWKYAQDFKDLKEYLDNFKVLLMLEDQQGQEQGQNIPKVNILNEKQLKEYANKVVRFK